MFLMFHSVEIYFDYVLVDCSAIMPDDHRAPQPCKTKETHLD